MPPAEMGGVVMPNGERGEVALRASTSVVVMGLLAVLFIASTFGAMAWQRRTSLLHDRQVNNERLADTLAEHSSGLFRQSALILSLVSERLDREKGIAPHGSGFNAFLASVLRQTPMVTAIRVVAPDGSHLHSHPERPPEGGAVADHDFIRVHQQSVSGLFLGKPIVSRVNGQWVLPISQAHRDANGRLVAVVAVMIHLDRLNALFESIRHKPNGTIALFRTDGSLLGRGPADHSLLGRDFSQGPLFRDHLPVAATGSYTSVVATDGKLRQASYRRLGDIPAVVSVSSLHDDVMAEWRDYATTLAVIAVPLILAAAAITWALHRQLVEREHFERLLARRTADLELANAELRYMAEIAAHHLQEPLRTVLSYAQLLVRKVTGGGELEEYLGFIRSGVERMRGQLDALQRYLGVEQCRPHQLVSLSRILDETIEVLEPRLGAAGTSIQAGRLPSIMGDRQHLAGLFHHMVTAIVQRRRPDTRQTIAIDARRDGDMWHLTLRADNTDIDFGESETSFPLLGAGSPTDQGDTSTVSLALCRRIVQMHGGRLSAETTGDGETRLHVLLPVE